MKSITKNERNRVVKLVLLGLAFSLSINTGLADGVPSGPKFKVGDCLFRVDSTLSGFRFYYKIIGISEKDYVAKPLATFPGQQYNYWEQPFTYNFDFLEQDVEDHKTQKKVPGTACVKIPCEEVPAFEKNIKRTPNDDHFKVTT